jgi:hypothetical protein
VNLLVEVTWKQTDVTFQNKNKIKLRNLLPEGGGDRSEIPEAEWR